MSKQANYGKVLVEGNVHSLGMDKKGVEQGLNVSLVEKDGVRKLKYAPRYKDANGQWGFGFGQSNVVFEVAVVEALIKDLQSIIVVAKSTPIQKVASAVQPVESYSIEALEKMIEAKKAQAVAQASVSKKASNKVVVQPVEEDLDLTFTNAIHKLLSAGKLAEAQALMDVTKATKKAKK